MEIESNTPLRCVKDMMEAPLGKIFVSKDEEVEESIYRLKGHSYKELTKQETMLFCEQCGKIKDYGRTPDTQITFTHHR